MLLGRGLPAAIAMLKRALRQCLDGARPLAPQRLTLGCLHRAAGAETRSRQVEQAAMQSMRPRSAAAGHGRSAGGGHGMGGAAGLLSLPAHHTTSDLSAASDLDGAREPGSRPPVSPAACLLARSSRRPVVAQLLAAGAPAQFLAAVLPAADRAALSAAGISTDGMGAWAPLVIAVWQHSHLISSSRARCCCCCCTAHRHSCWRAACPCWCTCAMRGMRCPAIWPA